MPSTLPELFARHPDPPLDRAALVLARDAYPGLPVEAWLERLDALAVPLARSAAACRGLTEQAAVLRQYLVDELGFRGDEDQYYDPRNSYLNEVIERRRGIPITLATVAIALGTRAGLTVEGVGFPGHFLVRLGGTEGLHLDPFGGVRVLSRQDIEALAARALGDAARLEPEHLAPVSTRAIVVRMLTNLKGIYALRRDHARALVVCDRLVDLAGGPEQRRDRGLHAAGARAFAAAVADLEAYLAARPTARDAPQVRATLERARAQTRLQMQ